MVRCSRHALLRSAGMRIKSSKVVVVGRATRRERACMQGKLQIRPERRAISTVCAVRTKRRHARSESVRGRAKRGRGQVREEMGRGMVSPRRAARQVDEKTRLRLLLSLVCSSTMRRGAQWTQAHRSRCIAHAAAPKQVQGQVLWFRSGAGY